MTKPRFLTCSGGGRGHLIMCAASRFSSNEISLASGVLWLAILGGLSGRGLRGRRLLGARRLRRRGLPSGHVAFFAGAFRQRIGAMGEAREATRGIAVGMSGIEEGELSGSQRWVSTGWGAAALARMSRAGSRYCRHGSKDSGATAHESDGLACCSRLGSKGSSVAALVRKSPAGMGVSQRVSPNI